MKYKIKHKMKHTMLTLALALSFSSAFARDHYLAFDAFSKDSIRPHRMQVLNHGMGSLEARLELIEKAQESIDVEYFIYRTDLSAKIFTQALLKKAKSGVKVRVLLDYFMIKSDLSPFYTHELIKNGIEIKYFNTASNLKIGTVQYRNHRKVLLVDKKIAITGGRNIGDEYFDLHHEYNFLDRDVLIEGELVQSIDETFDITFKDPLSKVVKKENRPQRSDPMFQASNPNVGFNEMDYLNAVKRWEKLSKDAAEFTYGPIDEEAYLKIRKLGKEELDKSYSGDCSDLNFTSEYPDLGRGNRKHNRLIKHKLFDKIKAAQKSVLIDSPYFIVNGELRDSLNVALEKGVNVDVLTNSLNSTDAIYVYAAFDTKIGKWIERGLLPYIFKGHRPAGYHILPEYAGHARFGVHAKTFIFDDNEVIIGTFNVDPRSANFNSEMVISCKDSPELAAAVKADIELRMNESIHLDRKEKVKEAEFYMTDFKKKVIYYLLKVPSNLLSFLL